ncbi:MAG: hypothetical protein KAJ95_07940 [Gammaproteobacteria bacterium]|nr:hypothetical protein [Gammaproteobacteria bacterium]
MMSIHTVNEIQFCEKACQEDNKPSYSVIDTDKHRQGDACAGVGNKNTRDRT